MLPSFYKSGDHDRAWSIWHAAGYGALIGAVAAAFKILGPFHASGGDFKDQIVEVVVAAAAFAALCAGAAALRNYIGRRLIWDDHR